MHCISCAMQASCCANKMEKKIYQKKKKEILFFVFTSSLARQGRSVGTSFNSKRNMDLQLCTIAEKCK